jgi:hypothetical protein
VNERVRRFSHGGIEGMVIRILLEKCPKRELEVGQLKGRPFLFPLFGIIRSSLLPPDACCDRIQPVGSTLFREA